MGFFAQDENTAYALVQRAGTDVILITINYSSSSFKYVELDAFSESSYNVIT